ncbi:MAG: hypothetical protein EAX90_14075 [Candidatus Heimdallarchaeota archaeon]|nr:hypothetical protein [Candidatus Heimdallarchaeota archaeon]
MKKFPNIKGSNLEGRKFSIPKDLDGELNFLIIPFLRHQQFLVDRWVIHLSKLQKKYPFFEYYEIPTLAKTYTTVRFMIDGGMRAGIPDVKTRERTITVYTLKGPLKKKLGIDTEQTIYLYLLKGDLILWEEFGEVTEEKVAKLEEVLIESNKKEQLF